MMKLNRFINRKVELDFLRSKYSSDNAELIILYGRRRIGKTELILKFLESHKGMYFLGRLESRNDTLKRFNNMLIEFYKDIEIAKKNLASLDEIFDYIGKKADEKTVLVIDEFPFIIDKFPEIISILQDKWDSTLIKTQLKLIISGSSVSMMEKYALDYKSPLYGRRTGQWQVSKVGMHCLKEFFPKYNVEELLIAFSCLDAIPGYLIKFDDNNNIFDNIRDKILSKGEFLYEEVDILLREELRDPSNYLSILTAIAAGTVSFNEIYLKTQLDKSLLSKYIYVLDKLAIIEKILPVTETYKSKLKAKGALYFIKDNFIKFWIRFVYLNKDMLELGKKDEVINIIKQEFPQYLGAVFEDVVKDTISELVNLKFTNLGRWWHKDKEIDLVALNEQTKDILFVECKWQANVNAEKILAELKEKTQYVEWHNKGRKEHFCIIAKSFKNKIKNTKDCFYYDLKDMEKAFKK